MSHTICKRLTDAEYMQRKLEGDFPLPRYSYNSGCPCYSHLNNSDLRHRIISRGGPEVNIVEMLVYQKKLDLCQCCKNYKLDDFPEK